MSESRKPPRPPRSVRGSAPTIAPVSSSKTSGSAARLAAREAALAPATADGASLLAMLEEMRKQLGDVRRRLDLVEARLRKSPPPLPHDSTQEVIVVDEHEVMLESLRPKRGR